MAVTIISGGRDHKDPAIIGAAVKASGYAVTKIIEGGQRTYDEGLCLTEPSEGHSVGHVSVPLGKRVLLGKAARSRWGR